MAEAVKKTQPKKDEVKLNPVIWDVAYNSDLVSQVLYVLRSNLRAGTAHAKTRGDVSGGGRKPWKQKGTGNARAGSTRSPIWVKGGVTFVPNGRNWSRKINVKMKRKAMKMELSERLRNDLIEFVSYTKTADYGKLRELTGKAVDLNKSVLVISDNNDLRLALRNMPKVSVISPRYMNLLDVVKARKVVVDNSVIKVLEEQLSNEK
jgi:large subunit ribosomal protein L4